MVGRLDAVWIDKLDNGWMVNIYFNTKRMWHDDLQSKKYYAHDYAEALRIAEREVKQ